MSNEVKSPPSSISPAIIASLVLTGDMKGLSETQKVEYYNYRCQQAGLDAAAKPFDLLVLNGKMILYANVGATQQLTSIHKLSHAITSRELVDGIYCVFCRVTGPDGRSTENMGAVEAGSLKGEAKANAYLKATTKAIRRSVLAHMGLGLMDETEVETIPLASLAPAADEAPAGPFSGIDWGIDEREEFDLNLERAYKAFKVGGKPEAYEPFREKWRGRTVGQALPVLEDMAAFVSRLEAAAAKAAAAAAPALTGEVI